MASEVGVSESGKPQRKLSPVIILAVPLLIILGLGYALIETNQDQVRAGTAPDFTLMLYNGGTFRLSEQRGKVVLVNFWASWCGPCRSEAPELNTLFDEYQGRGLEIVGVGWLDNEADARGFLREFGVRFPTGHDSGSQIGRAYRIKGVPETYLINKRGEIARTIVSTVTARELRPILEELLAQPVGG